MRDAWSNSSGRTSTAPALSLGGEKGGRRYMETFSFSKTSSARDIRCE